MFSNNFKIPSSNNIDFISSRITYPISFPNQKKTYSLIVACHGIFLNKYIWDRLFETYINNDYIFVDMDLRGFGLSDGLFPPLASAAKDVLILTNYVCKKLENYYDPKRVTLMGFSLGGMVVIQALLQPNPFTSCVLLSSGTSNLIENNNNTIIIQRYFFLKLLAKLNMRQMGDELSNVLKYAVPNGSILFANMDTNNEIPLYIALCPGDHIVDGGVEHFCNNQNINSVLHIYQGDHGTFEFEIQMHRSIMRWLDGTYEHKISVHLSPNVTINYLNLPKVHKCNVVDFKVKESMIPFSFQTYIFSHILRYYFKMECVLPRYLWDLCSITYVNVKSSSLSSFIFRLVLVADVISYGTICNTFLFLVKLIDNIPYVISYATSDTSGNQKKIKFSVPYHIVEPNVQLYLLSTRASTMFSPIISQGILCVTSSTVLFKNCHFQWETRPQAT